MKSLWSIKVTSIVVSVPMNVNKNFNQMMKWKKRRHIQTHLNYCSFDLTSATLSVPLRFVSNLHSPASIVYSPNKTLIETSRHCFQFTESWWKCCGAQICPVQQNIIHSNRSNDPYKQKSVCRKLQMPIHSIIIEKIMNYTCLFIQQLCDAHFVYTNNRLLDPALSCVCSRH